MPALASVVTGIALIAGLVTCGGLTDVSLGRVRDAKVQLSSLVELSQLLLLLLSVAHVCQTQMNA